MIFFFLVGGGYKFWKTPISCEKIYDFSHMASKEICFTYWLRKGNFLILPLWWGTLMCLRVNESSPPCGTKQNWRDSVTDQEETANEGWMQNVGPTGRLHFQTPDLLIIPFQLRGSFCNISLPCSLVASLQNSLWQFTK